MNRINETNAIIVVLFFRLFYFFKVDTFGQIVENFGIVQFSVQQIFGRLVRSGKQR
jgi:hypothetical protein